MAERFIEVELDEAAQVGADGRGHDGQVGGGRLPHRTRGKPPPRRTPAGT